MQLILHGGGACFAPFPAHTGAKFTNDIKGHFCKNAQNAKKRH
jgi:hypothetical protein